MPRKSTKTQTAKTSKITNKSNSLNTTKFTLYNFGGKEKAYYAVEGKNLERSDENLGKTPVAHSIIIIDCSGSMTWDIEGVKETLIKLLTLDEYLNSQLIITLISYASHRDVTCHFQRVPIEQIMKPGSSYIQEIKNMRTRGCTCISQSMELAKTLIKEFSQPGETEELTAITLHTDGYANDPSYNSEAKKIEAICEELKSMNVFVNTISYTYADFKFFSKIANTVSGSCLQAGNVKEVYDSLYQTSKLLSSSLTPPIEEPLIKGYDYQVFVSKSAKKINGSANTLKIVGLKPEDDGIVYKYRKLTKEEYEQLTDVSVAQTDESVLAFIKANLSEGNLNFAKYGLVSTFDTTLIDKHAKALTNNEIAAFTQDIEQVIFQPSILDKHSILNTVPVSNKITLLQLIDIFEQDKNSIIINLKDLQENYQRKGLKRVRGSKDENGNLIEPWLTTEAIDGGEYVRMGSFDINRNTATINMLITRKVKLIKTEDKQQITEVAGILVNDLAEFNNYTIVSDGEINVKSLKVKINNQQVFELLKEKGVLSKDGTQVDKVDKFDFLSEYEIRLDNLPLVAFEENYGNLEGIFQELAEIKTLSSIIAAHLKEESDIYTAEQLEELKRHYLSKNLYLNFPTTNEYNDLQEALKNGTVDTRVSYKIDIGNQTILNLSKLHSANKFLDRLYEVYDKNTGEKIEKPTFDYTLDNPVIFGHKTLSSRTKITQVDELMRRIFDNFLGLEDNGSIAEILAKVNEHSFLRLLQAKWKSEIIKKDEFIAALTTAKKQLDGYAEKIYCTQISPLVFYIGSTGLIPDEMNTKAMTAEEISAKYPDLNISKSEKEGMFFEIGNSLITVYTENEYFSVK